MKIAYLVKRKNDIITKFEKWIELIIKNIKSLAEVNQVKKSNINKFCESNLIGFKRIVYLNSKIKIIKKEPLKSEDCENINILEE